jgi:endoglucanase
VGGVEAGVLLAKQVLVGGERVAGVIGAKPVHFLRDGEGEKPVAIEDLYIDIGAADEEQARRHVRPGDYISFATEYGEMGGRQRTVKAKALDDRVGCYILARLLERDWDLDLNAVFTVQEEVGLRGARVAAASVKPDLALVLEGTVADDLPGEEGSVQTTSLGGGPAITLMDRTFLAHRGWVDLLVRVAEREGIPFQFKTPGPGGTEAGAIHLAGEGVPCAVVAVPIRYIHSPVGIMNLDDMEHTLALARSALEEVAGGESPELEGERR